MYSGAICRNLVYVSIHRTGTVFGEFRVGSVFLKRGVGYNYGDRYMNQPALRQDRVNSKQLGVNKGITETELGYPEQARLVSRHLRRPLRRTLCSS